MISEQTLGAGVCHMPRSVHRVFEAGREKCCHLCLIRHVVLSDSFAGAGACVRFPASGGRAGMNLTY